MLKSWKAEDCTYCIHRNNKAEFVQEILDSKYLTSRDFYNAKVINDIMYNE